MTHLVEGIIARQREDFGRALQLWTAVAPLLATSTSYGFSGDPTSFNNVTGALRKIAHRLLNPNDEEVQEEVAQAKQERDVKQEAARVAGSHPLFTRNVSESVVKKLTNA